ncbi:MAG: S1 RNA-binding domain-containing protein [Candidatus Micrarchaeota archaeon]|nr:S1 RNA-binding domain-containing protein [Candidatus Micrarchaeota archaeon]
MPEEPELDELVLATVKKIMPYGAFCSLDEYGGREAFVHISEVAPRWIKNIHEFLHEGQKLVAKVYHIEPEKNQIDLSLKRVTESEKKAKLEESRREKRAEKLFEVAIKLAKSTKAEGIAARSALAGKYGNIIEAMEAIGEKGEEAIAGLKIEKGLASALLEVASKNIKKAHAEVSGVLTLFSYEPNGAEIVRKILLSFPKPEGAQVQVLYLGAPKYQLKAAAQDFKTAEKALGAASEAILSAAKEAKASAEFCRMEK